MKERLNRIQIEWMPFINGNEYCLLDKILYQSNLINANNGEGFKFHIRQLSRETGIDDSTISRILKGWFFMEKVGETKNSYFKLNYERLMEWIVSHRDNDCLPGETMIVSKTVTKKKIGKGRSENNTKHTKHIKHTECTRKSSLSIKKGEIEIDNLKRMAKQFGWPNEYLNKQIREIMENI